MPRRALAFLALLALLVAVPPAVRSAPAPDGPRLVQDLNKLPSILGPTDLSQSSKIVTSGNLLFFAVSLPSTGQELWRSDGTADGTFLVKDIRPGPQGSDPRGLVAANGRVFFAANDSATGDELWASDGTSNGTYLVKDARSSAEGALGNPAQTLYEAAPSALVAVNGLVFFGARIRFSSDRSLWRSDGTAAGTFQVFAGPIGPYAAFKNALFFSSAGGGDLWKTDGTQAGTARVATNVPAGPLIAVGDLLFLYNGADLWRTDGTAAGTVRLRTILRELKTFASVGGTLYFITSNANFRGDALWRSDGTPAGTLTLKDFGIDTYASELRASGNAVLFGIGARGQPAALWRSDGTEAGTVPLATVSKAPVDRDLGIGFAFASQPMPGGLRFVVSGDGGDVLWSSNGTPAGTRTIQAVSPPPIRNSFAPPPSPGVDGRPYLLAGSLLRFGIDKTVGLVLERVDTVPATRVNQLASGNRSSGVRFQTAFGSRVVFFASDGDGEAVWASDGTPAGITLLKRASADRGYRYADKLFFRVGSQGIYEEWVTDGTAAGTQPLNGLASLDDSSAVTWNGRLFFAGSGTTGTGLWASDGTPGGTSLIQAVPGSITGIRVWNGRLFFGAVSQDGTPGGLWASDGTPAGTTLVRSFGVATILGATDQHLIVFTQNENDNIRSLWISDGTAAGTTLLRTFGSTASVAVDKPALPPTSAEQGAPAASSDKVFFIPNQSELWFSDGTAAGTVLLKRFDITPFGLRTVARVGDRLFLSAETANGESGLWTGDGTAAGTVRLTDRVVPANVLGVVGQRLFFTGQSDIGYEPWVTDGTVAGTQPLKDIFPGVESSAPSSFTVVGQQVFFSAGSDTAGRELWATDGTPAGTRLVRDIASGPPTANPTNLAAVGDRLLFAASDGSSGNELWASDGTANGTWQVGDLAPGSTNSNPNGFTPSAGPLFFRADRGDTGEELWTLPANAAPDLQDLPLLITTKPTTLTVPLVVANRGLTTTGELSLSLTLGAGLRYVSDTSGITPTVEGNTLRWHLPPLANLQRREIAVAVTLADAPLGTRYSATATLATTTAQGAFEDTIPIDVLLAYNTYLPVIQR